MSLVIMGGSIFVVVSWRTKLATKSGIKKSIYLVDVFERNSPFAIPEDSEEDVINCHRVVLSSRCPWFRRALQAGMKESRERLDANVMSSWSD